MEREESGGEISEVERLLEFAKENVVEFFEDENGPVPFAKFGMDDGLIEVAR